MANANEANVDELGRKFEGATLVDNEVIARDLRAKNYDLAFTVYEVHHQLSRDSISGSSTGSTGDDSTAASTSNTSVLFGEGGTKVLVKTLDVITALDIEAHNGGKEEKAKDDAKKKVRKEKVEKADREKEDRE